MPHATPIIGQRFLETDIAANLRKIPHGVPLPLAGLFHGDKKQLDRIEQKLDRLLALLSEPRATASGLKQPVSDSQAVEV